MPDRADGHHVDPARLQQGGDRTRDRHRDGPRTRRFGVVSYDGQTASSLSGPWATPVGWSGSATPTITLPVSNGQVSCLRAAATDASGNTSDWSTHGGGISTRSTTTRKRAGSSRQLRIRLTRAVGWVRRLWRSMPRRTAPGQHGGARPSPPGTHAAVAATNGAHHRGRCRYR